MVYIPENLMKKVRNLDVYKRQPQDNVVMSDPGYLIIGNFANRFAGEVRYVPVYNEECEMCIRDRCCIT